MFRYCDDGHAQKITLFLPANKFCTALRIKDKKLRISCPEVSCAYQKLSLVYNIRMYRIASTFAVVVTLLLGVSSIFAQTGAVGTELAMSISPEHPRPGESVMVSVESYNIDLNRSEAHWFVNDKPIKTGTGGKQLQVLAGRNGEATSVRVVVLGENGTTYSASIIFRPAEVNLLWQAESYTPPFYKGKALMPYQGTVLVA